MNKCTLYKNKKWVLRCYNEQGQYIELEYTLWLFAAWDYVIFRLLGE